MAVTSLSEDTKGKIVHPGGTNKRKPCRKAVLGDKSCSEIKTTCRKGFAGTGLVAVLADGEAVAEVESIPTTGQGDRTT